MDDVSGGSLGARAQGLRDALAKGVTNASVLVLVDEAARIADRLDQFDEVIAGKGVLGLMHFRHMDDNLQVVEMKVDGVFAEARQQANALRQILVTLGVDKAERSAPEKKGTALDELNARRAERGTRATGRTGS
jgi:hypothetical protein